MVEIKDVLNVLFPEVKRRKKSAQTQLPLGDNVTETGILQELARGLSDGEEILTAVGLTAPEFSRSITMLELKGRVMALGMNRWALK